MKMFHSWDDPEPSEELRWYMDQYDKLKPKPRSTMDRDILFIDKAQLYKQISNELALLGLCNLEIEKLEFSQEGDLCIHTKRLWK